MDRLLVVISVSQSIDDDINCRVELLLGDDSDWMDPNQSMMDGWILLGSVLE